MISVEQCTQQAKWDEHVLSNDGHPLQLWGWGEVKAAHGWLADRVSVTDDGRWIGAAQILIRPLPGGFKKYAYIPRGPVVAEENREVVLTALADYTKSKHGALALTIEPDWETFDPPRGWQKTTNNILLRHTLILDLTKTEDELLEDIERKRRYDIRKSTRDVPDIHEATTEAELTKCLALYHETAQRAGFALHGDDYYRDIFKLLGPQSRLIAAWDETGEAIAFTWLAVSRKVAFELYGGINEKGQQLRANYGLKWWCITHMQQEGVRQYDFNGLLNDGISHFKRSFASHENYFIGTYDRPLSPLYPLWSKGLPAAKKAFRLIKNR